MAQETLNQILVQAKTLELEELQQLQRTLQTYLNEKVQSDPQAAFHQSLIDAGLVKQIKRPSQHLISERRLVQVEGKPVSETIMEERR